MKLVSILFLIHILVFSTLDAQDINPGDSETGNIKKNSLYVEILGNLAIYSINYDRIVPVKENLALAFRVGANIYGPDDSDELSINFLFATAILYGGPKHFFETSIGYTHFTRSTDKLVVFSGGYRFMGQKGLLIRLSPMYIYNTEKGDVFGNRLWGGLSVGYSF